MDREVGVIDRFRGKQRETGTELIGFDGSNLVGECSGCRFLLGILAGSVHRNFVEPGPGF